MLSIFVMTIIAPVHIHELGNTVRVFEAHGTHDHCPQSRTIDVVDFQHIQKQPGVRLDRDLLNSRAKGGSLIANGDPALEIEQGNAFPLPMRDFETHLDLLSPGAISCTAAAALG
jgi:hypothetical protein